MYPLPANDLVCIGKRLRGQWFQWLMVLVAKNFQWRVVLETHSHGLMAGVTLIRGNRECAVGGRSRMHGSSEIEKVGMMANVVPCITFKGQCFDFFPLPAHIFFLLYATLSIASLLDRCTFSFFAMR